MSFSDDVMMDIRGMDGLVWLVFLEGARPVDVEGRCEQGEAFWRTSATF